MTGVLRAWTFAPPSATLTASSVSSRISGSVSPLRAAARNSSTTFRAAAASTSVRGRCVARCCLARRWICWQLDSVRSRSSAISRCAYPNASRSTYTTRSLGVSRSIRVSIARETDSRCSAVSAGPSIRSPARTGSGSHCPTYVSRLARAEVS